MTDRQFEFESHRTPFLMAFRVTALYFILVFLPGPFFFLGSLFSLWDKLWQRVVPWVGAHILHLAQPAVDLPTGSGDTLFQWVLQPCLLLLALAGALLWSYLSRRTSKAGRAEDLASVFLRYSLALIMFSYGFVKVFPSQFATPDPATLMEPYGRSSPMHLLWTFMGASSAYTIFGGLSEVLGGVLLCFRRTAGLGALVTAGVMANVAALNYCYDVPVKLYSTQLFLLAVFLAIPELKGIKAMILERQPLPVRLPRVAFQRRWLEKAIPWVQGLFVALVFINHTYQGYQGWKTYGNAGPEHPYFGLYQVQSFSVDGREVPPSLSERDRWHKVAIFGRRGMVVQFMDEHRARYITKVVDGGLTLTPVELYPKPAGQEAKAFPVTLKKMDSDALALEGVFEGRSLKANLLRENLDDYLLRNRGFHWVSEYPYNR